MTISSTTKAAAGVLVATLAAGCGGDLCDATAADMAGSYTLSFNSGGSDDGRVELTIDEEGDVTARFYDDDGDLEGELDCTVEDEQLCALHVRCLDEDGEPRLDEQGLPVSIPTGEWRFRLVPRS